MVNEKLVIFLSLPTQMLAQYLMLCHDHFLSHLSNLLLVNHPSILSYMSYLREHKMTMNISRCSLIIFNFQENPYAKQVSSCAQFYSHMIQGQLTSYTWVNTQV